MKFLVLNGSPKGDMSVTVQSMKYLELIQKDHSFEYVNVIQEVKQFEKEPDKLVQFCKGLAGFEGVIWAFPLYHMTVHSEYKHFIELLFERKLESYFKDKAAGIFTTSIHFYDHTAHNYMWGICEDLGMRVIDNLSHDMQDLTLEHRRAELAQFLDNLVWGAMNQKSGTRFFQKIEAGSWVYEHQPTQQMIQTNQKITILTDVGEEDVNLSQMIAKFASTVDGAVRIENLNDWNARGYCLGCCKCSYANTCVYHDKDDYRKHLDSILEHTDILIMAGRIKDRYLSSRFKWYFDRSFCYTHMPIYAGKQLGFLIEGPLSQLPNLSQMLEVYSQMDSNLVGFISDECQDSILLDQSIETFVQKAIRYGEMNYRRASTYLGVGGQKIFRDAIAGHLGGIFKGDYTYYKKHGKLVFPSMKERLQSAMMRFLMGRAWFRNEVNKKMLWYMVKPHMKILDDVEQGAIK